MKAIKNTFAIPESIIGIVTVKKTFNLLAPMFRAASSMDTSKFANRPSNVMEATGKKLIT